MWSLGLLFTSAFLAATLLPLSSEAVLVSLLLQGESKIVLWFVATAGNTLGSAVNWGLGRYLLHFQQRKWFPFKTVNIQRSQQWFQRYGIWSLLFAWLPVAGDGLTFIAGLMRVPLVVLLLLVGVGKGIRYAVVIWLTDISTTL